MGLDWLRIAAFGLLISFHISLYFAPGRWIVHSRHEVEWLLWLNMAITPWRLSLLFAISGYATAAMLARHSRPAAFLRQRLSRLLVPLAFGMLFFSPPQGWVRAAVAGADSNYFDYLLHDHVLAFTSGNPDLWWEHLWFLACLAALTALFVQAEVVFPRWRNAANRLLGWTKSRALFTLLPAFAISLPVMALIKANHFFAASLLVYAIAFLFGVMFANLQRLRSLCEASFAPACLASLIALAIVFLIKGQLSGFDGPVSTAAWILAEVTMSWSVVIVLFVFATRFLNRDHAWRAPLSRAVFPAYIVHQTIIVVLGWHMTRWKWSLPLSAMVMIAAVLAGCMAAWYLARSWRWAGLVLGMPHKGPEAIGAPAMRFIPKRTDSPATR